LPLLVILSSASAAAVLLMAGGALVFSRASRPGVMIALLGVFLAGWQVGTAGLVTAAPGEEAVWVTLLALSVPCIVPALYQYYALLSGEYGRRRRSVTALWLAAAAICVTQLLVPEWYFRDLQHRPWGAYLSYGPGGAVFAALIAGSTAASVGMAWRLYRDHPRATIASRRGRLLLAAICVGTGGGIDLLTAFRLPVPPVGGSFAAVAALLTVYAAWRFRLVEITPGFAAQQFMDTMSDGVLVLDRDGMVRLVNAAVSEMLGIGAEGLLNRAPQAGVRELFLGEESGESFPQAGFVGQERQYRTPGGKRRVLSVSVSLMREGGQEPVAAVVTLRDITAATVAQEQIHRLAYYDALTGLPNRMLLKERFGQAMARAERARGMAAVLFLDLDRFKQVNDTLGHDAGDVLLKAVAERIVGCVRESDVVLRHGQAGREAVRGRDGGATLARLGGDEFVLLLSPIERSEDAAKVARRILQSLVAPFRLTGGAEVLTGVSIGISVYPHDGEDAETLLKKADLAMYHAKETGRNTFQLFDPAMNAAALTRIDLEAGLKRALARGEFALEFEAVRNLRDAALVGLDAQLVWRHPVRGRLHTADFLAVAEETGMAAGIFDWTLESLCLQLAAWHRKDLLPPSVTLAASVAQIEHSELLQDPAALLAAHRLPPGMLRLSVSGLGLPDALARVRDRLAALRAAGIAAELDGLGTGPLDLEAIRDSGVTEARIDMPLLGALPARTAGEGGPLEALVGLADALGLRLKAVRVASRETADRLADAGVCVGQGPLFGPPLSAEDAGRLQAGGRGRERAGSML
jgi:PAS domain S-box-containing protein